MDHKKAADPCRCPGDQRSAVALRVHPRAKRARRQCPRRTVEPGTRSSTDADSDILCRRSYSRETIASPSQAGGHSRQSAACRGSRLTGNFPGSGHGIFSAAVDQRFDPRVDLRVDRDRLHDGLRHHRHDQFRPWRDLHDRRLHRRNRFSVLGLAGVSYVPLALAIVLATTMLFTALYGWTVERVAYRPLRGSSRLAPLISAIGMSIFLQNYVQILQGAQGQADAASAAGRVHDPRCGRLRGALELPPALDHRADAGLDGGPSPRSSRRHRWAGRSAPASRTCGWRPCSASMSTG